MMSHTGANVMRILFRIVIVLAALNCACAQADAGRVDRVLSQEEQAALMPAEVLRLLEEGNGRFTAGTLTSRDHSSQIRDAAGGQFPKALVLSCVDSRIPVEDVFDLGIGDIFVARVAGNFENTDILGSMEFATKISGAKLILVLGHEDCGAVKAAIDDARLGNITAMLENIKPAVDALADFSGEQSSSNPDFVHEVAIKNIQLSIEDIRERSSVLRELEEQGNLTIVGAIYNMQTGVVEFLN
jgi:carbonic anhydrase